MHDTEWPPTYTVKRHSRAKHVKFSYTRSHGLQVTVPRRFSVKHIPGIIEENKDWIVKQKILHDHPESKIRPTEINIVAFNETWTVHYFQNDKRPRIKSFSENGIILSGDIQDFNVCIEKVNDWIKKRAKLLLIPYFTALANELGLPFLDVSVRAQSTLWGSCSQDKSIRLNYKLIFLPEPLMRHIMIHELCHTRHMNHSTRFWKLVASFDEQWITHKQSMKMANQYMPPWMN